MKNNADMPAMPLFDSEAMPCAVRNPDTDEIFQAVGLTKREHFAGLMMQGMLSNSGVVDDLDSGAIKWLSERATSMADALLAELSKSGE